MDIFGEKKSSFSCQDMNPRTQILEAFFSDFDIGPRTTCASDYVELYDVDTENNVETFISRYCGEVSVGIYRNHHCSCYSAHEMTSLHQDLSCCSAEWGHCLSHSLILLHCLSHSLILSHCLSHSLILLHCLSHSLILLHCLSHSLILLHCLSHSLILLHCLSHSLILLHCLSHSLILLLPKSPAVTRNCCWIFVIVTYSRKF